MNSAENDGYVLLGEYVVPVARRMLERMAAEGVRCRPEIIDENWRAWPWGPHGDFTRIAIFVDPGYLVPARDIQERVLKLEL